MLPFDPASLTQGIRVQPATFARMCQVSKQCVSQWIKAGKVTLFPDGTLDPAKAARQVIDNTHPGRLRAKVFKAAADDAGALRRHIATLEKDLTKARAEIAYLDRRLEEDERIERNLMAFLLDAAAELRDADDARFAELLDDLLDQATIASGFPEGAPIKRASSAADLLAMSADADCLLGSAEATPGAPEKGEEGEAGAI
jgi:hypothetical protein